MNSFIDIHTHKPSNNHISINILDSKDNLLKHDLDFKFCFGIHPWHIEQVNFDQFRQDLTSLKSHKNFFALGECGLDRVSEVDFCKQETVLKKQVELAKELNINILIIHCVRAYNECFKILKDLEYKGKIIFHGFNGNIETVQMLQKLDTYFSFGHLILRPSKAQKVLPKIDTNRIFFETDDSQHTISEIYEHAQTIIGVSTNQLVSIVKTNYQSLESE